MKFKFKNHLIASALMGGLLLAPEMQASTYNVTKLGTLVGFTNSYASGINASGQVVGYASTSGNPASQAALWQAGSTAAIDLNTLMASSSGFLTEAMGINDKGQIIAQDSNGFANLLTLNVTRFLCMPPSGCSARRLAVSSALIAVSRCKKSDRFVRLLSRISFFHLSRGALS
jgi:probable HAF family extracellular repeat protein